MMKNLGNGEFEFETKGIDLLDQEDDDECDDLERKLEMEADAMLRSWDRDQLLKEVADERDLIMRNKEKVGTDGDYYDGKTKFEDLIKGMHSIAEGQVFIKITEEKPQATRINAIDTILFDRIGYLEFQLQPFECSIYDGKPTKVNLIEGPILPGLLLAVMEMREGERADVILRPSLGFGMLGSPPLIPGDATLFYNIKIFKVWAGSLLDSVIDFEHKEFIDFPLDKKMSLIVGHKDAANKFLHDGHPRDALVRYKSAIKYIDELGPVNNPKLAEDVKEILITLLVNSAITMIKLEMPKSASKMAKRAIILAPKNLKAYYQVIKARIMLADYEEAFRWLEKAIRLAPPNDRQFDQLKLELDSKISSGEEQRRELYKRMARACF